MSGVNISDYQVEDGGIVWTASWDGKGDISYKGVDKTGNIVDANPPSAVVNKVKDYGATHGNNTQEPLEKELEVKTHKDGTVDANISEEEMTPRQRAFLDMMKKNANMKSVGIDPKTGNVSAYDNDGQQIRLSKEDEQIARDYLGQFSETGKANKGRMVDGLKKGFQSIGRGAVIALRDCSEMAKFPFRVASDLYKSAELIAKGKFRELRDRAALRVHDNLIELGVLPGNAEERIDAANKRIEERLGLEDREKNPNIFSKIYGRAIRDVKRGMRDIKALSGRIGSASVPIKSVSSTSRTKDGYLR